MNTEPDDETETEATPAKLPPVGPSGRDRFGDMGEWLAPAEE